MTLAFVGTQTTSLLLRLPACWDHVTLVSALVSRHLSPAFLSLEALSNVRLKCFFGLLLFDAGQRATNSGMPSP